MLPCSKPSYWRSRGMWLFFCFIWLTLTAPAWAQSQSPAARNLLTLEEAVNTALQDNRQVKNAALEVSKSEHMLAAMRTRRWPNFGVIVGESWLLTPQPNFNALGGASGRAADSDSGCQPIESFLEPAAYCLNDGFNGPAFEPAIPYRPEYLDARRDAGYCPGAIAGQAPDRGRRGEAHLLQYSPDPELPGERRGGPSGFCGN